jgi:pyruvate dehydrogenase E2 component (dihydrolipoamide acetyltransferase)
MPVEIILPKFGFTLETSTIVQWLKHDGDTVRAGDPICEVTTDKVNMEVEAPEAGTLYGLKYDEGAEVPVTEVICYLLRPGEAKPEFAAPQPVSQTAAPAPAEPLAPVPPATTPVARRMAEAAKVDLSQLQGSGPSGKIMRRDVESALAAKEPPANDSGKVRATPAARHLAEQVGINLAGVQGTGPNGRIQGNDVRAALQGAQTVRVKVPGHDPHATMQLPRATPIEEVPAHNVPAMASGDVPKVIKLTGMRRTIATRLQKSAQDAPHIFFDAQIDASGIESLRQRVKERKDRLSVTTILVKACTWALQKNPWLNATFSNDEIALWSTMNIGMAVALEEGLVVPVIHHTERLTLKDIQTAVDELAERARTNTLHVNDVIDGTFTISNLGMFGVDRFTAIINPPQVAILAVGRTIQQFVPDSDGKPVLRSTINLTLSADHRVVDGAIAARFLADLRTVLEEPALLAW